MTFKEYKTGQQVILDDKYEVTVLSQTPNRMFTEVTRNEGEDSWSTMTDRLTVKL